jgi:hypothetical protein
VVYTDLRARQVGCDSGGFVNCFGLGRTTVTAVFIEMEDARINYKPAVSTRTGLNGGWGVGFKFGVELWDWIPLQAGIRHASPNDSRPLSQSVMNCTQEVGEAPMCDGNWHDVTSTAGAVFVSVETGIEPNFRLATALALSPGLLIGHAGIAGEYRRSVSNCTDCSVESLEVDGSGAYLAPSLRLTWGVLGLALRYERYLQGDLREAIAIGFDFGLRYKSVFSQIPGEE